MTQEKEYTKRIAEFNTLFIALNDEGQKAALTILKSLEFAQQVMCQQFDKPPKQTA